MDLRELNIRSRCISRHNIRSQCVSRHNITSTSTTSDHDVCPGIISDHDVCPGTTSDRDVSPGTTSDRDVSPGKIETAWEVITAQEVKILCRIPKRMISNYEIRNNVTTNRSPPPIANWQNVPTHSVSLHTARKIFIYILTHLLTYLQNNTSQKNISQKK